MTPKSHLIEVAKRVKAAPRSIPAGMSEAYIGGGQSRLRYAGLKVPQIKKIARSGFAIESLDFEAQFDTWEYVWQSSDCYEVMSLALGWLGQRKHRDRLKTMWPRIAKWALRIDNWAHGDELCGIYADILESQRKDVLPTLERWSEHKSPWLRRISLVSLIFYASQRERILPFKTIARLIQKQIHVDHHYVQRAVGWTLRELGHFHPKETLALLDRHATDLSAIAFSAAAEKLTDRERNRLKAIRKMAR